MCFVLILGGSKIWPFLWSFGLTSILWTFSRIFVLVRILLQSYLQSPLNIYCSISYLPLTFNNWQWWIGFGSSYLLLQGRRRVWGRKGGAPTSIAIHIIRNASIVCSAMRRDSFASIVSYACRFIQCMVVHVKHYSSHTTAKPWSPWLGLIMAHFSMCWGCLHRSLTPTLLLVTLMSSWTSTEECAMSIVLVRWHLRWRWQIWQCIFAWDVILLQTYSTTMNMQWLGCRHWKNTTI